MNKNITIKQDINNKMEFIKNTLSAECTDVKKKLDTQRYALLVRLNKFLGQGLDYTHNRVRPTLFEYISLAKLQGKSIRQIGEELHCIDLDEAISLVEDYKEAKRQSLADPKLGYDILIEQLELFNSLEGQAFTVFNQTVNLMKDCNFEIDAMGKKAALPKLFSDSGSLLAKSQQLKTDLFARLGMYDKVSKDLRADQSKLAHQEANELREQVTSIAKGEKIDIESIEAIQDKFKDRLENDSFEFTDIENP